MDRSLKTWLSMLLFVIIGIATIELQAAPIEPASHQEAGYLFYLFEYGQLIQVLATIQPPMKLVNSNWAASSGRNCWTWLSSSWSPAKKAGSRKVRPARMTPWFVCLFTINFMIEPLANPSLVVEFCRVLWHLLFIQFRRFAKWPSISNSNCFGTRKTGPEVASSARQQDNSSSMYFLFIID